MSLNLGVLRPGTVFGRYVITRLIGRGGMGCVYEAEHAQLKKRVALKTLHPEHARSDVTRSRFLREGEMAARIRHPNVVDVTDVGVEGDTPYLVMEYLEGGDLAGFIARTPPLTEQGIVDLMLPIVSAVHAAHRHGIVHRDLKPENIFLSTNRFGLLEPKLVDFGISKSAGLTDGRLTQTKDLIGTPYYMSPEQLNGAKQVDALSDQYSLGVILYELSARVPPFQAEELFPLMQAIVAGQHVPLAVARPDLPPDFCAAVERALHKDRHARFETVADLGRALLKYASPGLQMTWERALHSAPPGAASDPRLGASPGAFDRTYPSDLVLAHSGASTDPRLAVVTPARTPRPRTRWAVAAALGGVLVLGLAVGVTLRSSLREATAETPAARPDPATHGAAAPVVSAPHPAPSVAPPEPPSDLAPASVAAPESAARPPPSRGRRSAAAAPSTASPSTASPSTASPSAASSSPASPSAASPAAAAPPPAVGEAAPPSTAPAPAASPTPPKKGANGALILQ